MNIAYFDCFHGAAGDMLLASLLDAGLDLAALQAVLAGLPLSGYHIEHRRSVSHHVSGSRLQVHVDASTQPVRTWVDIRAMLETSSLPERTRVWALGAFGRLARVEAAIHAVPVESIHFHEIGAVDSIVDLVGVCAGLELLGVEQVYASALPLGRGWMTVQHGRLPVPAPATLALLAEVGAPVVPGISEGELLTPSAAALLAELAHFEQPAMRVRRVGYGFGQKEFDHLNGLRVWIGETVSAGPHPAHHHEATPADLSSFVPPTVSSATGRHLVTTDQRGANESPAPSSVDRRPSSTREAVVELRCNLDDVTGEIVAHVIERLLAAGALDAWAAPLMMKKGRPGTLLACLARPADVDALAQVFLRETPTLGVRWERMQRLAAGRRSREVTTPWGSVRLKQKLLDGVVIASSPEYEDCAALARAHDVPLVEVFAAALQNAHKT